MNKTEIISTVAAELGLTKKDTTEIIDKVFEVITDTIVSGDEVHIPKFGRFYIHERTERMARNPRTGEKVQVGAAKSPKFKASKTLKNAVKA